MKYTVYDKYDNVLTTKSTALRCSKIMGVSINTFYRYLELNNKGLYCHYTIYKFDDADCILDGCGISKIPRNMFMSISSLARLLETSKYNLIKFCLTNHIGILKVGIHGINMVHTSEIWRVYADCISE